MYMEFQLSTNIVCRIFRNWLQSQNLCVPYEFEFLGEYYLVDRIYILENTTLHREPTSYTINGVDRPIDGDSTVLRQSLRIDFVSVTDLEANGLQATPPAYSAEVSILVDITGYVEPNEDDDEAGPVAMMRYSLNSVDWGEDANFLDETTLQRLTTIVSDRVPPISHPIDLTRSLAYIQEHVDFRVTNFGVLVSNDGEILLLRIEFNGSNRPARDWTVFYNSYNRNLIGNKAWALLIDKEICILTLVNGFRKRLQEEEERFALKTGPVVWYVPGETVPSFQVNFSGDAIDACACFFGQLDIDVDVSNRITMHVPQRNILQMRINVSYEPDYGEVFCCALTNAIFWAELGKIYVAEGEMEEWQYALSILTWPIGIFIATLVLAGDQPVPADLDDTCTKIDNENVECVQGFNLNLGEFGGQYFLEAIDAQTDGPALSGMASEIREFAQPDINVQSDLKFHWRVTGDCSIGFHPQLSGQAGYYSDTGPIFYVCNAYVHQRDDPLGVFQNIGLVPNRSAVIYPSPNRAYYDDPYECKLRIFSNGGARILTFEPVEELDNDERMVIESAAMKAQSNCYKTFSPPERVMEGIWRINPPTDEIFIRLWKIVVAELGGNESIDIIGPENQVLVNAMQNDHNAAYLSYYSEGINQPDEIGIRLNRGDGASLRSSSIDINRHVSMKQIQYIQRSKVGFDGDFISLSLNRSGNSPILSILTSTELVNYNISTLRFPSLLSKQRGVGRNQLLFSGPNTKVFHQGNQLKVMDAKGANLKTIACESPAKAAIGREYLVVVQGDTLNAFNISKPGQAIKIPLAKRYLRDLAGIDRVKVVGVDRAFCLTDSDGIGTIIDLSDLKKPGEIGRYYHTPWFMNSARDSKTFVKLSTSGKYIGIYELDQVESI